MPLTVGTAGHIDHGKTTLVEALTGKNTDRLPQEQERGISIDLGYAPLELPDGTQLSVVDVPGHERFVRTMVAGATGIDLFLLVIDANEGARPQTHEHLAILRLLGIERGVVALTKSDLVDEETLELARAEAEELVPGAPVVAVSARTGAGLDDLRAALASVSTERSRNEAPTRLYVDRVFTLRGIGTVATGTLWSGSVGEGDELQVGERKVRVRSVQVHDSAVARAEAGQRVAVALPGVERAELRRGDALVAPGAYPSSYRLDESASALRSFDSRNRSSQHAATTSSFAQRRPSGAGSCSTPRRRVTRASSAWNSSSGARLRPRCTSPSGPNRWRTLASLPVSKRPAAGSSRARGWRSSGQSSTTGSSARIHSTPGSHLRAIHGRAPSYRSSVSSGAVQSSTDRARQPNWARAQMPPPPWKRSSASSR
jgi:small GTP-binding protein